MSTYKNILVALECGQDAKKVLSRAAQISQSNPDATVYLLHVVLELIIADWAGSPGQIPPPLDQEALAASAGDYLKPHIEASGLDPKALMITFGSPTQGILKQAENYECDLIIAGSHSRHGLEVLLGSTAHKILNLAKSDVLLVRCPKN